MSTETVHNLSPSLTLSLMKTEDGSPYIHLEKDKTQRMDLSGTILNHITHPDFLLIVTVSLLEQADCEQYSLPDGFDFDTTVFDSKAFVSIIKELKAEKGGDGDTPKKRYLTFSSDEWEAFLSHIGEIREHVGTMSTDTLHHLSPNLILSLMKTEDGSPYIHLEKDKTQRMDLSGPILNHITHKDFLLVVTVSLLEQADCKEYSLPDGFDFDTTFFDSEAFVSIIKELKAEEGGDGDTPKKGYLTFSFGEWEAFLYHAVKIREHVGITSKEIGTQTPHNCGCPILRH